MKRDAGSAALTACLALAALAALLPFYVLLATALKTTEAVLHGAKLAPPWAPTLAPLAEAWSSACIGSTCEGVAGHVWTSVLVAVPGVVASVALGLVNGYALSLWRVPGAHALFGLLLAANALPVQAVLIPLALTLSRLGLFGTPAGLVLVHAAYGMPILTLLFRNAFLAVPERLVHAARLDGAGFWRILWHVVLPLAPPVIAVAAMLQFTGIWNDYLFALVLGGREPPVTVAVNTLVNAQPGDKEWNVAMAAVLIATLPTAVVYLLVGRWVRRGAVAGSAGG